MECAASAALLLKKNVMYQPKYTVEVRDDEDYLMEVFYGDNRNTVINLAIDYLYSHKDASYFTFYKI